MRFLIEQLRSVVDESLGDKVAVSSFTPRVAAAVKARTKKRQIYVTRQDSVIVSPSTHAPEYDNFDYSFYLQLDLVGGKVTDLRQGMEPYPKGKDRVVQLTSTVAVLSGSGKDYINLYAHPDAVL